MNIDNFLNKKNLKAVFFDLDGTLIQSMNLHYKCWKLVLKENENILLNKKDFMISEGISNKQLLKNNFNKYKKKIDNKKIMKLTNLKDIIFKKNYKIKYYPFVRKFLKKIKNKYKIAIVTSASKKRINMTLPNNFLTLFDFIITSDNCKKNKPFPDPYLDALKTSKLKSFEVIVIENSPLGIKSSINANIFTIGIKNTLEKKYLKRADLIIDNFNQLNKII